jgi:hypothetical protein
VRALEWAVDFRHEPSLARLGLLFVLALVILAPRWSGAQAEPQERPASSSPEQTKPVGIEEVPTGLPAIRTIEVPHDRRAAMVQTLDASFTPQDKPGIWVLEFAFKPVRIKTVDIPGKGKRQIHYLYYRVVNRTRAPRRFTPGFVMVNDKDEQFEASIVAQAVPLIQMREDVTIRLLGGAKIDGILPPSSKTDVDDAAYGVATWEKWDQNADRFSIYVRGLSDGTKEIPSASGGKPSVRFKTLKLDFVRRPDQRNINPRRIQLGEPSYEWVYW